MNLRNTLLFPLFFSFFQVSAQTVLPVDTAHAVTIRIDPSNANGGTASEVFESVNYIPLETTKESLFGRIDQLEVTRDYFLILDQNTNSILIFKRDGKFHAKISGGKYTMQEYFKRIRDFKVNKWTGEINYCIWDSKTHTQTLFFYSYDGKKIREEVRGPTAPGIDNDGKFLTKDLLVTADGYRSSGNKVNLTNHLAEYIFDLKEVKNIVFPYQTKNLPMEVGDYMGVASGPLFDYGKEGELFYIKPNEYKVFKLRPDSVQLAYKFLFPLLNALPADFTTSLAYKDKRMQFLKDHPYAIYGIGNCFLLGNNLTFKATNSNYDTKNSSLIYNLNSGTSIALGQITTDRLSYFLPLADDRMLMNTGFIASDGQVVYSSFSSMEMFQANESNAGKNIKYNSILSNYFSTGKKEDNPVLVEIKLKEDL